MPCLRSLSRAPVLPVLVLFAGLAGCADFPELDRAIPPDATRGPYPDLLPFERLLDAPDATITEATLAGVTARVAALDARAARLRGPVIDRATRARMRRGVGPV